VLRDRLAAELHRLHGCADLVCVFVPDTAGGRLEPLSSPGRLEAAGLTPREADVAALLLARRTNAEIRDQLVLSVATVRAHCRTVLHKLGVADRRALWAAYPPTARW
jgi:DNA-binding CsgD family transcriptional regulator